MSAESPALLRRGGAPFTWGSAVFWAATWAVGAALGVAIGGWMTAVGGVGAPGAAAIDATRDLTVLPAIAAAAVFAAHIALDVLAARVRGRRASREQGPAAG